MKIRTVQQARELLDMSALEERTLTASERDELDAAIRRISADRVTSGRNLMNTER